MEPNNGPRIGNNTITIYGYGFLGHGDLQCKFNEVQVNTTFLSTTTLLCEPPSLEIIFQDENDGYVEVTVSNNAHDWTPNNFTYFYYDHMNITGKKITIKIISKKCHVISAKR